MTYQVDTEISRFRDPRDARSHLHFLTVERAGKDIYPTIAINKRETRHYPIIRKLMKMLIARDAETVKHSKRLSGLAEITAVKLGYSASDAQVVLWAAMLHDIGKTQIPDTILRNPGPLTPEQWDIMKKHPQIGAEIVLQTANLPRVAWLVLCHHEKWDGSGYPNGMKGEDIPMGARILAVADAYNAIVDGRLYRPARSHQEAVVELERFSGIYYDPRVVKTFLTLFDQPAV